MSTNRLTALICHGTKRRLDMQGLGSLVERGQDGTVTAEALARADGGDANGLRVVAALWVQSQGHDAGPVLLVSDHEDAYDEGLSPDWKQETLFGPDRWQKQLVGHGVFLPASWGIEGLSNAKGLTRLKIER